MSFQDLLLGEAPVMQELRALIARIAPAEASVLVTGESGTGKELIARALHQGGLRPAGPWVAINCAALPASLIEGELFGAAKGAYTGATESRAGLIEQASGGTLFLDEIGELPLAAQAKLLRVLQERQVRRIGETRERSVQIRLVAATHRDLRAAFATGTFREDLFWRISTIEMSAPALRERASDVPLLAQRFLQETAEAEGLEPPRLSAGAEALLMNWRWPGNVRELKNLCHRLAVLHAAEMISPPMLPEALWPKQTDGAWRLDASVRAAIEGGGSLARVLQRVEAALLSQALHGSGGDLQAASERLGLSEKDLRGRMAA